MTPFVLLTLAVALAAEPAAKENPAASTLLAEARVARAAWADFPGFNADLEINQDGKVSKTKIQVNAAGKVSLDADVPAWVARSLGSVVGHRMPGTTQKTPCVFVDDEKHHPLGLAVRPIEDEYHSSYRIRDRVIAVVNRQQGDARFTITSIETKLNAEQKILPVSYVVDTWELKGGALKSSEAHHQTWVRVGSFDLPASILSVTSRTEGQEVRSLKLTGHKLK